MLVNYSRNHTGFVVGFDSGAQFFNEDGRVLRKVVYPRSPPVLEVPNEDACSYKSPEWEYEEEWRCVRAFDESETRLVGVPLMEVVTEIIFGHQMVPSDIARIVQSTGYWDRPLAYSLSSPVHSEWKFVRKPKVLTLCEHCDGRGYLMADER